MLIDGIILESTCTETKMGDDDRRIFIGGLRFTIDESTVEEYFRQWGPLSEVKIIRYPPPDSRSKGYGFVTFESKAARSVIIISILRRTV